MRGFGFSEHGGLERLGFVDVPEPTAGEEEVRIRVRASGFNRLDRFVLAGIPGVPIERPHVLGSDASGTVDTLGAGVRDLAVGDRVLVNPGLSDGTCDACRAGLECLCRRFRILGEHTQGSAAPFVVVPRRNVYRIPGNLSFSEAAAAPLVFQTAWRAIRTVGGVKAGERVAIVGAGGGTATAALQVAKLAGATVAVVTRSEEKASRARALGADAAFVISGTETLDRLLWGWSGKEGVDLIFDSVGAPTVPLSVKALARGGRLVVIGATAGPRVEVDLRTIFWRQASIRGSTMSTVHEFEEMLAALGGGRIRPVLDSVYPFDRAREAFEHFDTGSLFGKVILELPG